LTARQTVRQVVPSCRASPATEACSRRICLAAHHAERVLSSARGEASSSSTSVNEPTGQADSGQRQVRFRQISRTARPPQGTSTSDTSRRPRATATTPH
jgi:hypothetical protein